MKILLINPNRSEFVTHSIEQAANEMTSAGTEIVAVTGQYGAAIVDGFANDALAAVEVMRLAENYGQDCDAVVLGVSFDSGLQALRERLSVPVVGMTEAAVHTACMVSEKFNMVTFGNRAPKIYGQRCKNYGDGGRLGRVLALPDLTDEEKRQPQLIAQKLVAAVEQSIAQDQAEAVILSGAIFAGLVDEIAAKVSVPVLNGVREAVGMAKMLARLGLKTPTFGSYQPLSSQAVIWPEPTLNIGESSV